MQFPSEGRIGDVVGKGTEAVSARADQGTAQGGEDADAIPEIRPWCEAGWIFRDGDARAIERQGDSSKVRTTREHHGRDE